MLPVWVNALITIGIGLLSAGFVCLMFAFGIKAGFRDAFERHGYDNDKKEGDDDE